MTKLFFQYKVCKIRAISWRRKLWTSFADHPILIGGFLQEMHIRISEIFFKKIFDYRSSIISYLLTRSTILVLYKRKRFFMTKFDYKSIKISSFSISNNNFWRKIDSKLIKYLKLVELLLNLEDYLRVWLTLF